MRGLGRGYMRVACLLQPHELAEMENEPVHIYDLAQLDINKGKTRDSKALTKHTNDELKKRRCYAVRGVLKKRTSDDAISDRNMSWLLAVARRVPGRDIEESLEK